MESRLASNSQSPCLSLSCAGITGYRHKPLCPATLDFVLFFNTRVLNGGICVATKMLFEIKT
jgi:hypothetical protein